MLYPVSLAQHGPLRSLNDYLDALWTELANNPNARPGTERAQELAAKIRMIEDELAAREGL